MTMLLKRLAAEAGIGKISNTNSEADDASLRRFAELILEECYNVIDIVSIGDYAHDEWDRGYEDGLAQAIETIKEHFGVNNG